MLLTMLATMALGLGFWGWTLWEDLHVGYQPIVKRPRGKIVTARVLWGLFSRVVEGDRTFVSLLWGAFVIVRKVEAIAPARVPQLSSGDQAAFAAFDSVRVQPKPTATTVPGPGIARQG